MAITDSSSQPGSGEAGSGRANEPGRFRRALRRLTASEDDLERADLRTQTAATSGATEVARCGDRDTVCVVGSVRSTQVDMRGGSPMLNVELYDGTGAVTLVFLGRRKVAGIEAGRNIKVSGRVTVIDGRRTMYNPSYELLASTPA